MAPSLTNKILSVLVLLCFCSFPLANSLILTSGDNSTAPAPASPVQKYEVNIPSGPWAPLMWVGGNDGTWFSTCPWVNNGALVQAVEVWSDGGAVRGVQLGYTDGTTTPLYGTMDYRSHDKLTLEPGERISTLTLWGNGRGTLAGRIRMTTNRGKTLDVGKNTDGQDTFNADVGGGILVGAFGASGYDIDSICFLLLRSPLKSFSITDIQYEPGIEGSQTGIQQQNAAFEHYIRPATDTTPYAWKFSGSTQRTSSHSWGSSSSNAFGVSEQIKVSAKVFKIVDVGSTTGFSWTGTWETNTGLSTTDTFTLNWETSGSLDPGQRVDLSADLKSGTLDIGYSSTIVIVLMDGTQFQYKEDGQYKQQAYSDIFVERKISPI